MRLKSVEQAVPFLIILSLQSVLGCSMYSNISGGGKSALPQAPRDLSTGVYFQDVSKEIFQVHCVACHGNSGGVNLESYASTFLVLDKIRQATLVDLTMPKSPEPGLTIEESKLLSAWLDAGAPEYAANSPAPTPSPTPIELQPNFTSIRENILQPKCYGCHKTGGVAARVSLDTLADLINSPLQIVIPGDPEESDLTLVLQPDALKRMPPPSSGITPVSATDISIIAGWIKSGAVN